jgi:predicted enzyme related to lactoylglutathione lyase
MSSVQIDQKSYEMPPKEGISIAHFLTVADVERSARYYEKVFGGRILTMGDGNAPPYLQLANIWMILNVGGGPTPDKPTVSLSVPDPNHISSFMNFRVADIQACYELWKSRGAEFITAPIPKYGEIRCYIRDPDGLSSRSDRAPIRRTVDARPGREAELNACGTPLRASLLARTIQHRSAVVSREAKFARGNG